MGQRDSRPCPGGLDRFIGSGVCHFFGRLIVARYTKKEQAHFEGLNGGRESCMERLIRHVGVTRLSRLLENVNVMIADANHPEALRKELRIIRLMLGQLDDALLEFPCQVYTQAHRALETIERQMEQLQESFERDEGLWQETADNARTSFLALRALYHGWKEAKTRHVFRLPELPSSVMAHDVFEPLATIVPTEIEKSLQCRFGRISERNKLFQSLNEHLSTHDDCEGLTEMEELDEALLQMDELASACHQHVAEFSRIASGLEKAQQALGDAYRGVAVEMCELPIAGQISLVRLLRLLMTDDYEGYRTDFAWLLKRPVPPKDVWKQVRVTVIDDGKSFERPLAEPVA